MRRRLVVAAPTTSDVVRFAGGWLFDRAMSGWDVAVCTADAADARALRILGVRAVDLESLPWLAGQLSRPHVLAVHVGLRDSDARVAELVVAALSGKRPEVLLWGRGSGPGAGTVRVPHRLSAAAQAFKAHALSAVAAPPDADRCTEVFMRAS